jgi:hypothetical protein
MLFTLSMLFTIDMRIGGKRYALFSFHLETILRDGNGIFKTGDAFEPYRINGVLQGAGGDAQSRYSHGITGAPRSQAIPSLKLLAGLR